MTARLAILIIEPMLHNLIGTSLCQKIFQVNEYNNSNFMASYIMAVEDESHQVGQWSEQGYQGFIHASDRYWKFYVEATYLK